MQHKLKKELNNSKNVLSQIISSLPAEDKSIVNSLHETALALGYTAKISPVGKKPDDWKCEYIATKPKRVLYILRITGQWFSIRAKLFHIAEYCDVLENCTEHCKASLLSASKDCENQFELKAPNPDEPKAIWFNILVPDIKETFAKAISAGCTEVQPVIELPDYGVPNAMFVDTFGYQWMLHQIHKEVSFEERVRLWEEKRDH